MQVEKRKAHIQITGHNTCVVTTLYKQKVFKFKKSNIIDLINLTIYEDCFSASGLPFYAICCESTDTYNRTGLCLDVFAKIDESHGLNEAWGQVGIYGEKEKTFQGVICYK